MWFVTRYAPLGSLLDNVSWFRGDTWRTLRMARDIATALAAAHARKIVHRDVKPGNVLLYDPNHFALTDFGIAHHPDHTAVTSTHERVGPRWFLPPESEQGRCEPTAAHDVYMLGKLTYFALTGGHQFFRERFMDSDANIERIFARPEYSIINELFGKMIVEDAGRRLQSMEATIAAIDATTAALLGGGRAAPATTSNENQGADVPRSGHGVLDETNKLLRDLRSTKYATNIYIQPIKDSATEAPFHLKAVEDTFITLVKESNEDHLNIPLAHVASFTPRSPHADDRLLTLKGTAKLIFDGQCWRFRIDS
jgi:serine/threonine protein kinase